MDPIEFNDGFEFERADVDGSFMPQYKTKQSFGIIGQLHDQTIDHADELDAFIEESQFGRDTDLMHPKLVYASASEAQIRPEANDSMSIEVTAQQAVVDLATRMSALNNKVTSEEVDKVARIVGIVDHKYLGLPSPTLNYTDLKTTFGDVNLFKAYAAILRQSKGEPQRINNPITLQESGTSLSTTAALSLMQQTSTNTRSPLYMLNVDTLILSKTTSSAIDVNAIIPSAPSNNNEGVVSVPYSPRR